MTFARIKKRKYRATSSFHVYWRPGTHFSKVPKLFGRILGDIILFVSSKRRRLEAQNFEAILISGSEFYEWLSGPEKFSGLSRNRPLVTTTRSQSLATPRMRNLRSPKQKLWQRETQKEKR